MFTVVIEMPSGATSHDHSFATEDEAKATFDRLVSQMTPWKKFTVDVVMTDGQKEIKRERIINA
jgi:hypothetical protein